jgi:flagellar biogenesis protein FliO
VNAPSTAELLLRLVISLAIMGVLLWGVVRVGRGRRGRALLGVVGGARVDQIELRARRQLSRSASLTLVRVGSRTLLLGIGDGGVAVLAEGDDLTVVDTAGAAIDGEPAGTRAPGADGPGPARTGAMDALRELTVRR